MQDAQTSRMERKIHMGPMKTRKHPKAIQRKNHPLKSEASIYTEPGHKQLGLPKHTPASLKPTQHHHTTTVYYPKACQRKGAAGSADQTQRAASRDRKNHKNGTPSLPRNPTENTYPFHEMETAADLPALPKTAPLEKLLLFTHGKLKLNISENITKHYH